VTGQRTPTDGYATYELGTRAERSTGTGGVTARPAYEVAAQIDALRIAAGRVDALAAILVESYDHADWRGVDPVQVERLAQLLGVTAEAATAMVAAVDKLHACVADRQPAEAGDEWDP
jgi:hypothetical protein